MEYICVHNADGAPLTEANVTGSGVSSGLCVIRLAWWVLTQ